jgi:hypothetical protein
MWCVRELGKAPGQFAQIQSDVKTPPCIDDAAACDSQTASHKPIALSVPARQPAAALGVRSGKAASTPTFAMSATGRSFGLPALLRFSKNDRGMPSRMLGAGAACRPRFRLVKKNQILVTFCGPFCVSTSKPLRRCRPA